MNDFRVSYVGGRVPLWKIQHGDTTDIALTPEDALRVVGRMLSAGYDRNGGDFRVLWDDVPFGTEIPDLEAVTEKDSSPSH